MATSSPTAPDSSSYSARREFKLPLSGSGSRFSRRSSSRARRRPAASSGSAALYSWPASIFLRSLFTFIASTPVMTPAARPRHRSSPLPPHEFRRAPGAVRQRHLGQAEEVEIDEGVQHQVKAHDADDPQHRFLARPLQLLPDRLHA